MADAEQFKADLPWHAFQAFIDVVVAKRRVEGAARSRRSPADRHRRQSGFERPGEFRGAEGLPPLGRYPG